MTIVLDAQALIDRRKRFAKNWPGAFVALAPELSSATFPITIGMQA